MRELDIYQNKGFYTRVSIIAWKKVHKLVINEIINEFSEEMQKYSNSETVIL